MLSWPLLDTSKLLLYHISLSVHPNTSMINADKPQNWKLDIEQSLEELHRGIASIDAALASQEDAA